MPPPRDMSALTDNLDASARAMSASRLEHVKALWLLCGLLASGACAAEAPLAFRIDEGRNINSFFREGPIAAHLLLRSGNEPRILVAFPAGNGGVGLWFAHTSGPIGWSLVSPPKAVLALDDKRRPMRGIEFDIETNASEQRAPRCAAGSMFHTPPVDARARYRSSAACH